MSEHKRADAVANRLSERLESIVQEVAVELSQLIHDENYEEETDGQGILRAVVVRTMTELRRAEPEIVAEGFADYAAKQGEPLGFEEGAIDSVWMRSAISPKIARLGMTDRELGSALDRVAEHASARLETLGVSAGDAQIEARATIIEGITTVLDSLSVSLIQCAGHRLESLRSTN